MSTNVGKARLPQLLLLPPPLPQAWLTPNTHQ